MTRIQGLSPIYSPEPTDSLPPRTRLVIDAIEGMQTSPAPSLLSRFWNWCVEKIRFFFQFIASWFSPPSPSPSPSSPPLKKTFFQKIPEDGHTTYFPVENDKVDLNLELKLGKNRTDFLGTSLPKERLKKVLPHIIKEENIHEIFVDNLKKSQLLSKCGLVTESQIQFDPLKGDPLNKGLLNVLKKSFAERKTLGPKQQRALKRVEFEMVTAIIDPYSADMNLKKQKGQLENLKYHLGIQFNLKKIMKSIDKEHSLYLKTNLEELIAYKEQVDRTACDPFSLSVTSVLALLEGTEPPSMMTAHVTCIFKERR